MKRNEEKGSRDFPLFRRKTAGRWCRSCPVVTCPPSARFSLRTHTDHKLRPWRPFVLSPARTQTPISFSFLLSLSLGVASTLLVTLCLLQLPQHRLASPSASASPLLALHPPCWACSTSLRQSGADTPPSLVTVTGGFFYTPRKT